jgi:DNA-binding response OmpR family regulator
MNMDMTDQKKTIIVVEDEQDAADMFAEMMSVNGFHVMKATGSKLAMNMIDECKPAAVILDIMMPDISGLEILRYIQQKPVLAGIPVIVVSAKSLPVDIKTALEAGASIYLTKPVDYLDLKRAVDKVLGA